MTGPAAPPAPPAPARRRYRGAALAAGAALALALGGWLLLRPSGPPDADLVTCLDPGHRVGLARALVSLGEAGAGAAADLVRYAGADRTVEDFRRRDPTGFDRACAAFAEARRGGAGGGSGAGQLAVTSAVTLLATLLGGWLTRAGQAAERRAGAAAALRTALGELATAAEAYLDALPTPDLPAGDPLRARARAVGAAAAALPGGPALAGPLRALDAEVAARPLTAGSPLAERAAHGDRVGSALAAVESAAAALAAPGPGRWRPW
ncbi:hypothetical protein [Pilimelia anulata]|uniref:hypothetical protein n=1 Tax=Pilimelia anulata TaxID=53371 RepID=UPI00166EC659|nr:hypothetical protein [Pilimelia anulata]